MLENVARFIITDENRHLINSDAIQKWRRKNPNGKVIAYLGEGLKFSALIFYIDRLWIRGKLVKSRDPFDEIDDRIRFLD